jgi:AhpD family alkylhydroperoxidase
MGSSPHSGLTATILGSKTHPSTGPEQAAHEEVAMDQRKVKAETEIRETLDLVPEFLAQIPDFEIEADWTTFKDFELGETVIPNKYKELIGIAVSGATRCRYCAYYHTKAAKLFGATDEEINEAALMAKHTMAWSTYLNARQFDHDRFTDEVDQVVEHVHNEALVPA